MNEEFSRMYAEQLLKAKTREEVRNIIGEFDGDCGDWKPLGRDENNFSTVHNQADSPMPSLTELTANAVDAELLRGYREADNPSHPNSMYEASEAFGPEDSKIDLVLESDDDEGLQTSFTVRDNGCGKSPYDFEDDFLGLSEPGLNKQDYDFLQGQHGMGSSGVLKFSGEEDEKGYKFIASAGIDEPGIWSWSIIRKADSHYEYFVVEKESGKKIPPTFSGGFGSELLQYKLDSVEDRYRTESSEERFKGQMFGSFVKVYDYQFEVYARDGTNDVASNSFRKKFQRFWVNPPLDIQYVNPDIKGRGWSGNTEPGLLRLLYQTGDGVWSDNYGVVKDERVLEHNFDDELLGSRDLKIILFKDDEKLEDEKMRKPKRRFMQQTTKSSEGRSRRCGIHDEHAVLFTVNGQTHAYENLHFLQSGARCDLPKTGEDVLVVMECDDFTRDAMTNVFNVGRDRLQNNKLAENLRDGVEEAVLNCDMLREEESRRRSRDASKSVGDEDDWIDEWIENDSEAVQSLATGEEMVYSGVGGVDEGEGFGREEPETSEEEREHPTYLNPIERYDSGGNHDTTSIGSVTLPLNRSRMIRFETDAQDDYLSRDTVSGDVVVEPGEVKKTVELSDGVLRVTVQAEEEAVAGTDRIVTVKLVPDEGQGQ